ncbi:MAG: alpha,alpha-trehalose-phosphate synthase (UDP-forming) [Acidimicrobiales bacterium]
MPDPGLVIVSNRGPLNFARDAGGRVVARKGAGGLVSAIAPSVAGTGASWVAAAVSDEEVEAAESGVIDEFGVHLRLLKLAASDYRAYYDVIANSTLWYLHHGLFDLPRRPWFDRHWWRAWEIYRSVNRAFAELVAGETADGATVIVHDYHLALVGAHLAEKRPDLRTAHFNHTPFCPPDALDILPDGIAEELFGGLAGFGACGFHTRRWADAFTAGSHRTIGGAPPTFVSPAAADPEAMMATAMSEECRRRATALDQRGAGALIVRVDRIELSKNLLRGFLAFEELLRAYPEWRGGVTFAAFVYPSRESLADYLGYRREVASLAATINQRWATPEWTPIHLDQADDFAASVAGLRTYDVLLVNPVRDGLNLVAKEGPIVNERNGVLVLSRQSGAWDELGDHALGVNPYDVTATAEALHRALSMPSAERAERAAGVRAGAVRQTAGMWLDDQRAAARPPRRPAGP